MLIPEMLRQHYPEWEQESIDGFFFSSAVKTGDVSAELAGTCILISDQTLTPFSLTVTLSGEAAFQAIRIRLGQPGDGPLGISGPAYGSPAAQKLLLSVNGRLDQINWVYDVAA